MNELQVEKSRESQFRDALDAFEAAVGTPFVPGELRTWISEAGAAFARLAPLLDRQLDAHGASFKQIREQDQEMHQHVAQMQSEDAALRDASRQMADAIQRLQTAAAIVEPDEARLREAFNRFVDEAIALVVRARKQEQAVRTWLMEAFNRDRGTVD